MGSGSATLLLLGTVRLRGAGERPVDVGGTRRRAILAVLGLELGRVVPMDRINEFVWGSEPPPSAKAAVQGHVTVLRRLLAGTSLRLETRSPGYVLVGAAHEVDVHLFHDLVSRAATSDHAEAAQLLVRAVSLWRGAPAADASATPARHAVARRLADDHAGAVEAWAEHALATGAVEQVIPVLTQTTWYRGLREEALVLLLKCLYASGRRLEALEAYDRAREYLATESGREPGRVLREVAEEIRAAGNTAGSPADRDAEGNEEKRGVTPVPSLLPRRTRGFVGRGPELSALQDICRPGTGALAAVVGPAGVGKTATVVRWAHSVAHRYPDGQLFADLAGFDRESPADPVDVLGVFLRALGVGARDIPHTGPARADLYRALTHERSLLVVLDNAGSAAQAAPLIPQGSNCTTVITSRHALTDLVVAEGAGLVPLDVLPIEQAGRLLQELLGPERTTAEPAAVEQLIEVCDALPLALRVVSARLIGRPGWAIADLVAELREGQTRLSRLQTSGGTGVLAALAASARQLSPQAGTLLALLSLHPGPDIDAWTAASLLGEDPDTARWALGELTAYHLVQEVLPGRFARHDLVRLYGASLLEAEFGRVRGSAEARMLDYYLEATFRAGSATSVHAGRRSGSQALPAPQVPAFDGADSGRTGDWFRREWPCIQRVVARAAAGDEPERAWRLVDNCSTLVRSYAVTADAVETVGAGLAAARQSGSQVGLVRMGSAMGMFLLELRRYSDALPQLQLALDRARSLDDAFEIYHCLTRIAIVHAELDDPASALDCLQEALTTSRLLGDRHAEGQSLSNLAHLMLKTGRPAEAIDLVGSALDLLPDHNRTRNSHFAALETRALALEGLGLYHEAEGVWNELVSSAQAAGSTRFQASSEYRLGLLLRSRGRHEESRTHLRTAAALQRADGDRKAAADIEILLAP